MLGLATVVAVSLVLAVTAIKCVEIIVDMVWTVAIGDRFASAVRAEVDARGAVDIEDIERDFRRLQPVYRSLEWLARRWPHAARVLRAGYWAPGLASILALTSLVKAPDPMLLPLVVSGTCFTTLILVNAPLRRFALRGYDRYNRDILLGAWKQPGNAGIEAGEAVRAVTAYFLWLVYVSVLGFGATYSWVSRLDEHAFSTELSFPTATFFSLGVVSTVGFVAATAQTTAAQAVVALQVTTGPLILAWLLTEIAPHRAAGSSATIRPAPRVSLDHRHQTSWPTLVAAVLVRRDGKILLANRRRGLDFRPGRWDLIGGHVEPGENPRSALEREVYEETGVTVRHLSPEPDTRWIENGYDLRIWVVQDWAGSPRNYARGQHRKLRFFSVREARRLRLGDRKYLALFEEIARSSNGRDPANPTE